MSQEAVQAFVERVNDDETFRDGLIAADGNDARLQIAQEAGFDITAEDFEQLRAQHAQELSEEDLQMIAGGRGGTGTAASILGSGMLVGSIVTAAMLV
jgi:predicted ribosomally synthesized peptide with nif11-like leader